jgi:hypothetical protein
VDGNLPEDTEGFQKTPLGGAADMKKSNTEDLDSKARAVIKPKDAKTRKNKTLIQKIVHLILSPLRVGRSDGTSGGDAEIVTASFDQEYENLGERDYDVRDYYHPDDHWAVQLSTSDAFNQLTIAVIIANAATIYLLMDTTGSIRSYLIAAESFFLLFYTFELSLRFFSFREKLFALKDFWFRYDGVLVFLMWLEIVLTLIGYLDKLGNIPGVGEIIRPCLSAYRMARFLRVLRAMPSVVTIGIGILASVRSVMSTFYIAAFELFCVAVVFRARFGGPPYDGPSETEEEFFERTQNDGLIYKFRSVNEAFFLSLFAGVFTDNITLVMGELSRKSSPMMILFFCHVMLTNLTLLNILVGVVCAVIQEATDAQKDSSYLKGVKDVMLKHLEAVDQNDNKMISADEFRELLSIPEVLEFLATECSITNREIQILEETMFYDQKNPGKQKELNFTQLLQAILSLRTGKPATSIDLIALQRDMKQSDKEVRMNLSDLKKEVEAMREDMKRAIEAMKGREITNERAVYKGKEADPRSPKPRPRSRSPKPRPGIRNKIVTSGSAWSATLKDPKETQIF